MTVPEKNLKTVIAKIQKRVRCMFDAVVSCSKIAGDV